MTYQMTQKQILSGIAEAKADIKEAGDYYRLGLQMHGIKDASIKHYLRERGKHLVDWQKLLGEATPTSCQECGEKAPLLKRVGNRKLCEVCWSEE